MDTLDRTLFHLINNWGSRSSYLDAVGIFFAEMSPYLLAAFLIFSWIRNRNYPEKRETLLIAALSFVVSEGLAKLMGKFYYHVQPFVTLEANQLIAKDVNNSFPSDHTVLMVSFLFVLFLAGCSKSKWLYLFWAFLASIARIFVGVHYPSDVLVAALTAIAVGSVCYYSLRRVRWLRQFVDWLSNMEKKLVHRRT
ncbi:undecaprenyl-diphosphatase [Enterococcus sp. AZ072]|uniref:undecaprenyl-diphosphatase n=1 Tax=unclassified Enterococcus TaxID=2608891 RepID=UPI003D2E1657